MRNKIKKKKLIIGSLLAIVIIFLLFRQIDFEKLRNLKISINYSLLTISFLLCVLSNLLRAKRFNYVLNNPLKLVEMFRITSFYNLYTGLFPGGLGEFSFIYLIRKKVKKYLSSGLSVIIMTRIYDILILAVFLLITLVSFGKDIKIDRGKYIFAVSLITAMVFLITHQISKIIKKINDLFNVLFKSKSAWSKKINTNLKLTRLSLENNKSKSLSLVLMTGLLWAINFFIAQLFFRSFGVELNYFEAILMVTISNIIAMIPINTLAGFGYKEAGFAFGLMLIGLAKQEAIIYGFLVHMLTLAFMLAVALIGILVSLKPLKQNS